MAVTCKHGARSAGSPCPKCAWEAGEAFARKVEAQMAKDVEEERTRLSSSRCLTCDREKCPTLTMPSPDHAHYQRRREAIQDCEAHRVNWRLRAFSAKAAEAVLRSEAKQRRDAKQRERILCAAIWVDTGKAEPPRRSFTYPATGLLFTGWRHSDCFTTLHAWADLLPATERERIGEEQIAGRHQGFLTSRGRFVDRAEAMEIARTAGQTTSEKSGLFSEDLY